MPHEPLTGDALLDVLSEVPGDPAEPVPMRRHDYKLTPEDIAVLKDRQRREAEANPIFPPGGLTLRPTVPDPGQALDDAARRSVEARKSESLLPPTPRVITWDPVPLAITSWRVFINPTEEENPE